MSISKVRKRLVFNADLPAGNHSLQHDMSKEYLVVAKFSCPHSPPDDNKYNQEKLSSSPNQYYLYRLRTITL